VSESSAVGLVTHTHTYTHTHTHTHTLILTHTHAHTHTRTHTHTHAHTHTHTHTHTYAHTHTCTSNFIQHAGIRLSNDVSKSSAVGCNTHTHTHSSTHSQKYATCRCTVESRRQQAVGGWADYTHTHTLTQTDTHIQHAGVRLSNDVSKSSAVGLITDDYLGPIDVQ